MEDSKIIDLYWQRNQLAVSATQEKYGPYCTAIASNILSDFQDVEECVSDTWLAAWNSIPPKRPSPLSAFLGRITRNLSFNKARYHRAKKRQNSEFDLILDELCDIVSDTETPEQLVDSYELLRCINAFLDSLSPKQRFLFVRRYFYCDNMADLTDFAGMSQNHISVTLNRLRGKLKIFLTERGFDL